MGYRRRHGGWAARWLFPASEWQGQDRNWGLSTPRARTVSTASMAFIGSIVIHCRQHMGSIMGQGGAHFQSQKLVFSFIYWDATSEGPLCKPCTLGLSSNESTASHMKSLAQRAEELIWEQGWERPSSFHSSTSKQYGVPAVCCWKD